MPVDNEAEDNPSKSLSSCGFDSIMAPMNDPKVISPFHGILVAILISLALWLPISYQPVQAATLLQAPIYTPTPGPDGKIIYIVKKNDTLLSISLISGVSVDKLRSLNNLKDDNIIEGQKLILGLAGPAESTAAPGTFPTATSIPPSPTPKAGLGKICVILFNDRNGDSMRQEEEPSIPEGAISINNRSGTVSLTLKTIAGEEPTCFENIPEGSFTISVAVPAGYNATTTGTVDITLQTGDTTYVDFGAQANSVTEAETSIIPSEGKRSPILGIIGGVLLLAAIGLAVFAGRLLREK